jgi:hypothetical protein
MARMKTATIERRLRETNQEHITLLNTKGKNQTQRNRMWTLIRKRRRCEAMLLTHGLLEKILLEHHNVR